MKLNVETLLSMLKATLESDEDYLDVTREQQLFKMFTSATYASDIDFDSFELEEVYNLLENCERYCDEAGNLQELRGNIWKLPRKPISILL